MTTQRTDIHRPSLLDPADYEFQAAFYQGSSDAMYQAYEDDHRDYDASVERFAAFQGNWETKATCDHCGAAFAHGCLFLHTPTQTLIRVGHICANDTIGLPSKAAAARRRAGKAHEAAKAAEAAKARYADWREKNADLVAFLGREQAREHAYRDAVEAHNETGSPLPSKFDAPHTFVLDMVFSFNRYGGLTEAQTAATRKFFAKEAEFAAKRKEREENAEAEAAALAAAEPLIEGRRVITGTILSTKWQDSMYGETLKMLVKEDDGNKVWGTVPASITETEHGTRVTFTATVERSRDDEHFGFFKRPTGAVVVS